MLSRTTFLAINKTVTDQFAALARAGYATDPQYVAKLSAIYSKIKGFFLQTTI
jgi:flagellum-specific peptidoglycan hydrolase FlgJ